MAFGGEIATAFVRIRPNVAGFASEANAGVKAGLEETQAAVSASTKANVTSTRTAIEANQQLRTSYTTLGSGARGGLESLDVALQSMAETAAGAARSVETSLGGIATAAEVTGEKMRLGMVGGLRHAEHESEGILARMKGRLLNLGTLIGVGFGAEIALHFVKEITGAAAGVQKSIEVIKSTFGPAASEVVVGFGDRVASSLGISAEAADATSAKFGILFKNLGIGPQMAAGMTVNLEKLAGVLSIIRGVDPSAALGKITLAMLGNVRSLKQLGLAVDPAAMKIQAFKMGLIATTTSALTPAVRAQAIYAMSIAHLGEFQKIAAKHSGDLANQSLRLSAEWSNAKDMLGTALLPVFTRYTTKLADWLERMIHSGALQRDLNHALHVAGQVLGTVHTALTPVVTVMHHLEGALGGARNLVVGFLAVWAVSKLAGIAGAIGTYIIKQGIVAVGTAAVAAQEETTIAFAGIGLSSKALGITIKTALVSTGIGALIVAVGFAAAYVLTHWDKVKRMTVALGAGIASTWKGLQEVLIGTAKTIGGAMATYLTLPFRALLEAAGKVSGFLDKLHIHIGGAAQGALDDLKKVTTSLTTSGAGQVREGASTMASAFTDAWHKSMSESAKKAKPDAAAKDALYDVGRVLGTSLGKGMADVLAERRAGIAAAQQKLAAVVKAANDAVAAARANVAKTVHDTNVQIAGMIRAGDKTVEKAAMAAATNLDTLGGKLAAAIAKFLAKGKPKDLAGSPLAKEFKRLRDAIASGAGGAELINAAQEVGAELQAKQAQASPAATAAKVKERVTRHITGLTDQFNQGEISFKQFQKRLLAYLHGQGASYAAVGKRLGKAQGDSYEATLKAVLKQAGIILDEPAKLRKSIERHGAGLAPKVIDVQDVQAQVDRKINAAKDRAAERVAAARHRETMAEATRNRRILSATLAEQKTIAKYTGQTAAHTRPVKPHKTATKQNPGRRAKDARDNANHRG